LKDIFGEFPNFSWEKVGEMCEEHLKINGEAARKNGYVTKIEPLNPQRIEAKA